MESVNEAAMTCRLLVTRRNASEILLLPNGLGWVMPRVEIHPHQRLAEQLTAKVTSAWGLAAYCLCAREGEPKCAVMESVRQNDKAPAGTFWVPRTVAEGGVELNETRLIQGSLDEFNAATTNRNAGPLARPGWLRELYSWAQNKLTPFGVRLTGGFRQLNASPAFSLIRLETDREAVWFKATGEPNSHELRVTATLARLFPGCIPTILAIHQTWNGWLSMEVAGVSLDQLEDFTAWERAAEELAELQIASIARLLSCSKYRRRTFGFRT